MTENSAPADRLAAAQERRTQLVAAATRLQKLTVGLANLTLASTKPRKLKILSDAQAFVQVIKDNGAPGLNKLLGTVSNELSALRDGVRTGEATDEDLHPVATAQAVTVVKSKIEKLDVLIAQLQAGSAGHDDQNEKTIERNREFKNKLPNLANSDSEFAIARMPVAFTFQNKQRHSSVGYVDLNALDILGFKAENVAGYTILHGQMMLGVNVNAIHQVEFDEEGNPKYDELGRPVTKPKIVRDTVVKFTKGKPTKVQVRRPKTLEDVAREIIKTVLNPRTKLNYELVSQKPVGANHAAWFWVMPAQDIRRLSKAMPGNHVGIAKWGFGS